MMAGGRALWVVTGALAGLAVAVGVSLGGSDVLEGGGDPPDTTDDPEASDEGLPPESRAAGRRFAHCFVGQWNPDGTLAAVSASIRG